MSNTRNTRTKTTPKTLTIRRLPGVVLAGNHVIQRVEPSVDAALSVTVDNPNHVRRATVSSVGGTVTVRLDEHGILQIVVAGRGWQTHTAITPKGEAIDQVARRGRVWRKVGKPA